MSDLKNAQKSNQKMIRRNSEIYNDQKITRLQKWDQKKYSNKMNKKKGSKEILKWKEQKKRNQRKCLNKMNKKGIKNTQIKWTKKGIKRNNQIKRTKKGIKGNA